MKLMRHFISRFRTLESELAEANEQLRRSQQLAALGEMAAGIAHEITKPTWKYPVVCTGSG